MNSSSIRRAKLIIFSLIVTFIFLRIYLFFSPDTDLDIGNYNVHHIYTGLLFIMFFGIPLGVLSGRGRFFDLCSLGFGAGLSMSLDELVYIVVTDGSNAAYLLPVSFWGGVFMVSLAVFWTLLIVLFGVRGNDKEQGIS